MSLSQTVPPSYPTRCPLSPLNINGPPLSIMWSGDSVNVHLNYTVHWDHHTVRLIGNVWAQIKVKVLNRTMSRSSLCVNHWTQGALLSIFSVYQNVRAISSRLNTRTTSEFISLPPSLSVFTLTYLSVFLLHGFDLRFQTRAQTRGSRSSHQLWLWEHSWHGPNSNLLAFNVDLKKDHRLFALVVCPRQTCVFRRTCCLFTFALWAFKRTHTNKSSTCPCKDTAMTFVHLGSRTKRRLFSSVSSLVDVSVALHVMVLCFGMRPVLTSTGCNCQCVVFCSEHVTGLKPMLSG